MKKLQIQIDTDKNAEVVFTVEVATQQFQLYLSSFDQLKGVYQKDLHRSLRSSLGFKRVDKSELVKNDKSRTVSYTFRWKKCVEKVGGAYRFHLKKVASASKISRGIGLLDLLEIRLPQSASLVSVQPEPSKRSGNTVVWADFDWSRDLKVEFSGGSR